MEKLQGVVLFQDSSEDIRRPSSEGKAFSQGFAEVLGLLQTGREAGWRIREPGTGLDAAEGLEKLIVLAILEELSFRLLSLRGLISPEDRQFGNRLASDQRREVANKNPRKPGKLSSLERSFTLLDLGDDLTTPKVGLLGQFCLSPVEPFSRLADRSSDLLVETLHLSLPAEINVLLRKSKKPCKCTRFS